MDIDHRVELFIAHLVDHRVPGVTGIVDDDIDATECLDARVDIALGETVFGDAADYGDRFAARVPDLRGDIVSRFLVKIVNDELCALRGEFQCHRTPDTAAGSRDKCDLSFEFAHLRFASNNLSIRRYSSSQLSGFTKP